jgi:hypothetical protein
LKPSAGYAANRGLNCACPVNPSAVAQGAPCYTHSPSSVQRWLLRQQLQPLTPQHALGRRDSLLQHTLQLFAARCLQKSERLNLRAHLRLVIAISTSCASAPCEAKRPSVEATRAAPPSFIALPREIAPLLQTPSQVVEGANTSFISLHQQRSSFLSFWLHGTRYTLAIFDASPNEPDL